MSQQWDGLFAEAGAVWRYADGGPHAAYELVDRHSDFYFNSDLAVSDPAVLRRAVDELARHAQPHLPPAQDFWIVTYFGSISASLVLATGVSSHLNKKLAYMDIRTDAMNFPLKAGDSAIIVTDDVHSGGSIRKLVATLGKRGITILPVLLTMGNFSGVDTIEGLTILALFAPFYKSWTADDCPLCRAGSKALQVRQKWSELQCGASAEKAN